MFKNIGKRLKVWSYLSFLFFAGGGIAFAVFLYLGSGVKEIPTGTIVALVMIGIGRITSLILHGIADTIEKVSIMPTRDILYDFQFNDNPFMPPADEIDGDSDDGR